MVAENVAREADQDRSQGGQAFPVHHLSDGRGSGAPTGLSGHSRTDSTPQTVRNGAEMTETNGDNAGEPGKDRDGLLTFAQNGLVKTVRGKITAR